MPQLEKIITTIAIAVFKAIMELCSTRGFDHMGKKVEVVTEGKKSILVNFHFTI